MIWIVATLAALAVLGALAALLVGRLPLEGMSTATSTVPDLQLGPDPTASQVAHLRFDTALRGYRISQVDEALDLLQDRLAAQERELAILRAERGSQAR